MYAEKVFIALALIACLACIAEAAVYTQPAFLHPAHPGKCYDRLTRRAMLPDKEYKPKGICAAMTCDIEARQINIETCPYIEMPGCEELPSDLNWSFPKCCPQFKCVDFKTGKEFIVSV
ncbi:hypothetical protein AWZ03_009601 [Drosophila navojoa]|uniref:Single domain-containing protein n=1 Tax=Drosophila navojoa TaxID=7232 RepID=A0A484B552_DRONA|nr:uncharacterized protein LOC108651886 [Drosophila navojoa]TDG43966.1 hypothetical protein AWZ03_009601 [Drosophila navojoa]